MTDYPVLRPGPPVDHDGTRLRYGGCLCGAVRFTLRGEPSAVGICHCMECRKATGAVAMAYADWPAGSFSFSGAVQAFCGRSFCPACGTRVFHLRPGGGAEVLLGALDDGPGDLVPTQEGWTIRREHWLAPVAGAAQFERDVA
ncbi:MAG: GFA family protein [Hyphomicrobiales bacterium]|nr:MAG: GFA family protein [Hyphomicrobiales bacterium]